MAVLEYALIDGTQVFKRRRFDEGTNFLSKAEAQAKGKPWWVPFTRVPAPSYDPATHHAPAALPDVITDLDVSQEWASPVAKTAQELDNEKEEQADEIISGSRQFRVVLRLIFEILKAQRTGNWSYFSSVTDVATFKALVKGLL